MVSRTVGAVGDHELLQLGEHQSVLLVLPGALLAGVGAGQGAGEGLALVLHRHQVVDHLLTLGHVALVQGVLLEQGDQGGHHRHVEDGRGVDGYREYPAIFISVRIS